MVSNKNIISLTLLLLLAFFSFLMLRIIWAYVPMNTDTAFLQLKQQYINITEWQVAFFIHVFSSMLVLFAGFTQFSKTLLRRKPKLHRTAGYIYVINILIVTGPAAFLMSFYANGGISSRIGFIILSVLWIGFTSIALYYAWKRKFKQHRIFMIRSFAMTLSAVSLRIWKVVLANFTDIPPMDRYRIIAWAGWVINLLVAEYIIYKICRKKISEARLRFS